MISQSGKKIIEHFVSSAKNLLMENVTQMLQQYYGIWADGHSIIVEQLPNQDTDIIHTARMLRERLRHLLAALPEEKTDKERLAVSQLIAEQAFTQLNRFCALRMCEERDLILESIRKGYDSAGFLSYDAIAGKIAASRYERYKWYLYSIFDELSVELPAVFDRFSPYGLIFPDESTLNALLQLINDSQLSDFYDEQDGTAVNFWTEDETLGWMFQYYNSLEERRQMRDESTKPRNSREMAVRNQFFTPEYIVRFLTDNTLGRIWYEMTDGKSRIGEEQCLYMVQRPDEVLVSREMKEPTEILSLDPTCGSMHFGIYLYEVYEYIYRDAWDNHPELLHEFREIHTRDSFLREVPRLILEKNIYGCEIDPRALQIAALSLWLRAQKSYGQMNIQADERPLIKRSNLVLAEAMPGNRRLLKGLIEELPAPMRNLITKIWQKMQYVGEAGLLFKMEKEIEKDIEELRKNWAKVNQYRYASLFATDEQKAKILAENEAKKALNQNKEEFFNEITERLREALQQLSAKLSEDEGYENALFSEDATRGFAFIELCQKRFDCIVMNPPFGEGSENTSGYLDDHYPAWGGNLVCAFFERMKEMLTYQGKSGAIFDRTVLYNKTTQEFRIQHINDYVYLSADSGTGVLDASVDTTTLILNRERNGTSIFFDIYSDSKKESLLQSEIVNCNNNINSKRIISIQTNAFSLLPNAVTSYKFNKKLVELLGEGSIQEKGFQGRQGIAYTAFKHYRLFYELTNSSGYKHLYNGSSFSMFYTCYRLMGNWKNDGLLIKTDSATRVGNTDSLGQSGVGYGRRCMALNAHILKRGFYFTTQGLAFPGLSNDDSSICLSFLNSSLYQYIINLYTAEHKHVGYVNKLPISNYTPRKEDIKNTIKHVIDIKRKWFSMDETNLEFKGLISQLSISSTISDAIDIIQKGLSSDNNYYCELVKQNDNIWFEISNISKNDDFRKEVESVLSKRSYEELLSIDGACKNNIIDKKVLSQEIVQELVGMAFGRWDTAYATGEKTVPEFGDVFDALPFMPIVSIPQEERKGFEDILTNQQDSPQNIVDKVRDVMHHLWGKKAENIEYELCQLIGCNDLQAYFENPKGFFDYHLKRYTKSHRKAPIYWPLSSEDGSIIYWIYYPQFTQNTLHKMTRLLGEEKEALLSQIAKTTEKIRQTSLRARLEQIEGMKNEFDSIIDSGYKPNHDDGVPVTACPLVKLIRHSGWRQECTDNLKKLQEGEYDWSHLAFSLYPARITQKAKNDWCMALTHGLEHLCENKPKEKKKRKKKVDAVEQSLNME